MDPLILSAYTLVSALGQGLESTRAALRQQRSGLRPCDFLDAGLNTWIGRVEGVEAVDLPESLIRFDCRNNRLAYLGMIQDGFAEAVAAARDRYGPVRIGVVVGTSTSGILETELAYRARDPGSGELPAGFSYQFAHNTFSVADFTRCFLALEGPAVAVSTACSSSSKAFASGFRLIAAGLCDAVVVGGVDSLCLTTLLGFSSLDLVSDQPCRPADRHRNGISIGEAAGYALLERTQPGLSGIALLGYGESTDAYHMSSPHPEGLGARLAMSAALERAGIGPGQVDYINLHGTATRSNDTAEDKAVTALFGHRVPASSIKGWTGHTLGAAGIVNAIATCLSIRDGFVPVSLNTVEVDPQLQAWISMEPLTRPVNRAVSNAFGFGGNNVSLVFGRVGA
ncbi:MAG: beta-ketoacyl-[acyl-carrier-protein] synthase family protein [Methylococcaceae bacterium]|nr:beta-ketoacyl-[acyl-carrier-protein] synthase family protein [Methylococcaceae bacterium]